MTRRFFRALVLVLVTMSALVPSGCPGDSGRSGGFVYQLQGYADGRLDALAAAPFRTAVVDLVRDGGSSYFRADEIRALKASGKRVLAYFEIGSIESFRPDFPAIRADRLLLNEWPSWPGEHFVRYWEPRWWELAVRPRLDQALSTGFDGVYLDTPLAYEEIDLALVPAADRAELGRRMVDLIVRTSAYVKHANPAFAVYPQNSPELREYSGYLGAIDGIGMEELFFRATDERCTADFCAENLAATRKLKEAGKSVLAVDYATRRENVAEACRRYREEGFEGYVTVRALDTIAAPCH